MDIVVTLGALAAGFVSGLAGFGTGLIALGIWLHVMPPSVAAPLVVVCSIVSQVQTFPAIWHAIRPRRVVPFIIPGLIGVPVGTACLGYLDPAAFRTGMGLLLIGFSSFCLVAGTRLKIQWGGRVADGCVGLAGGFLGGLAGLPGPLPTMWAAVRGYSKDERRSLFQSFNLAMLVAALASYAVSGHLTGAVGRAALAALPGTLIGAWLGARAYRRLSDLHFHNVILALLAASGVTLLWSAF